MKITKMHALGNNYIYVNTFQESLNGVDLPALAVRVSDVRRGVGSDGLIVMRPSDVAPVRMQVFNADGSEAETCGNALRCVAKYVFERGIVSQEQFSIETKTSLVEAHVKPNGDGKVDEVTIDMGAPNFGPNAVHYAGDAACLLADGRSVAVDLQGTSVIGCLVSMGNPHFVTRVPDAVSAPVEELGPGIERHVFFPDRINVEFVSRVNAHELDFRVWERGSGVTYACGTGACAAVAAGIAEGWLDADVVVHLLGGDLRIQQREGRMWMTGEAVEVFTGEYQL